MSLVKGVEEPRGGDVRINLRRDEALVAEEFLNAADVRAGVEKVRGETVANGVR